MGPGQTQPFLYPGMYNPGQFAFGNNAEMSNLISMMAMPILGQMAGPGNFMPHMMPGQALFDQFTMRNYQQQTQSATYNVAGAQNDELATRLLGGRSIFTPDGATDLNMSQAGNIAGMLNNPMVKSIMGMAMGPDNVEALLHGSKGDIQNLGASVNKMGYFRRDPSGGGRMDAESLEDLTTGMFSHLYEPQGDLNKIAEQAKSGDDRAMKRLREASKTLDDQVVVSDDDVQTRLKNKGDTEVGRLYEKYVQGGTATDAATQSKELLKFDRAIKEAGVLGGGETTVGRMRDRAERMPVDEMHGFMAGQVGQLAENLAQRGVLPPSIGGMSAKDRVGAVAETKLDDATLDRLAQTMARRELQDGDSDAAIKYRDAVAAGDETAKNRILEEAASGHASGLRATKEEAEKFARGESTKSAEEIMQGAGGEALAGNVDASRSAEKLKGYTDALSAVRDIFGDNGNPNAPMPALMAMLDHLTQGGMGNMDPKKAASTLRSMQTLARETGTGMQQLAQMSNVAGNMGQQLGLAPSITMQNVAASMGVTKAAMDSGVFSNGVFGTMSKEQFQMENIKDMQTSAASGNGKALAAMNRIYKMDPNKFKGTELEAAMAAYNDPSSDGSYTFTDKKTGQQVKRNLYSDIGRGRQFAAQDVITRSGGSQADFYSAVNSPLTQQYANADKAYLTKKHQTIQTLSQFGTRASVRRALAGTDTLKDMSAKDLTGVSNVITGMVIDTAAEMSPEDQITYMQNNMKDKLKDHFISQGKSEAEAERMATETAQKMGGDRSTLSRLIGNLDTYAAGFGMGNLATQGQKFGRNRDVQGVLEGGVAQKRAEAQKRMVGYESTLGQRASDYFLDIGKKGEKFNIDQFASHMMQTMGDNDVTRAFAGRMGAGMHTLALARDKHQITDSDVEKLTAQASKGGAGRAAAEAELRRLGGVKDDTEVLYQSDIDAAKKTKIENMTPEQLEAAYAAATGGAGAHKTDEDKRAFLQEDDKYAAQFEEKFLGEKRAGKGDKKYVTEKQLMSAALTAVGQAKEGADKKELARLTDMQRAMERGQDTSALKAGVSSFFESAEFKKGLAGVDQKKLKEAILGEGNSQKDILAAFSLSEEEFKKGQGLAAKDKTDKQRAAEVAVGMDAAKEIHQDKLGGQSAADAKQKVDKANIDAGTVVINTSKVDGAGGAGSSAAVAVQAPGAAMPGDMAGIDAELAAIEKRNAGNLWDYNAPDKERRAELMRKKEELAQKELDEKTRPVDAAETKPDKPAEPPAKPPEDATKTPPGADGQLPPGSDAAQSDSAKRAADAAAQINAEQSAESAIPNAAVTAAGGGLGSANVHPASLQNPQQAAGTVAVTGAASGGGGSDTMTLNGKLRVEGLYEAVIAATTQKHINPPGHGPTVVADGATQSVPG